MGDGQTVNRFGLIVNTTLYIYFFYSKCKNTKEILGRFTMSTGCFSMQFDLAMFTVCTYHTIGNLTSASKLRKFEVNKKSLLYICNLFTSAEVDYESCLVVDIEQEETENRSFWNLSYKSTFSQEDNY